MPVERFYVVPRLVEGEKGHALVRAVPDPEQPHSPNKDSKTGETVLEGTAATFWKLAKDAGYRWTLDGFYRFWTYSPKRPVDVL